MEGGIEHIEGLEITCLIHRRKNGRLITPFLRTNPVAPQINGRAYPKSVAVIRRFRWTTLPKYAASANCEFEGFDDSHHISGRF